MTSQTLLELTTSPNPKVCLEQESSRTICFRSVAGEALKKLRDHRAWRKTNDLGSTSRLFESVAVESVAEVPRVGNRDGGSPSSGSPSSGRVGVRFHLRETNYDLIPIENLSDCGEPEKDFAKDSSEEISEEISAELRFFWTRGQSAASEEFAFRVESQSKIRGRLTRLSRTGFEFESPVKIGAGCRLYARATAANGDETSLCGIVGTTTLANEGEWKVVCRATSQVASSLLERFQQSARRSHE